jgi:hypothetical protein
VEVSVAALFVERNGVYSNLEGVDVWDVEQPSSRRSATSAASSKRT